MDFGPSIVSIDDIGAGCPDVRADCGYGYPIRVAGARRSRLLHRRWIGAHYLEYDVATLFLCIPLVQQRVLPRIEPEQKMLIAVGVDRRFLDNPDDAQTRH